MLNDITLGQYYSGDSVLHRINPRIKIILTLAYLSLVFLVHSMTGLIGIVIFTVFMIKISNIPITYVLKGIKPILPLLVFTVIFNLFTSEGTALIKFGFISITYHSIINSIKLILRISLFVIGSSMLTLTTTPALFTNGIELLLKPLERIRVPVHEMAMIVMIALAFIPILLEETKLIMKAQASRGADFDTGNIFHRAKSFIPVLVPLFVGAFRRADELGIAMEARCYKGGKGRTQMKQQEIRKMDWIIVGMMGIFFITILHLG